MPTCIFIETRQQKTRLFCLLYIFLLVAVAEPRETSGLLGVRVVGRAGGHAVRGFGVGGQVVQFGWDGTGVAPHVGKGERKISGC